MIRQLSANERKTFGLHLSYSVIEGIIRGVLILNEFVLIKTLHGTNYEIGILLQFQHMVLIFSVVFNEFLRRTSKKRRMINRVALYTRLPLLAMAFFPNVDGYIHPVFHFIFLTVFLIYYLSSPLVFPTINLLLKNSYSHSNFGKYFSYAQSINKIVMLGATFGFGYWLDINPGIFRWIYPLLGFFGFLSVYLLTKIDYTPPKVEIIEQSFWVSIKDSLKRMKCIIRTNKPYRDFEIGFMFYGFAFMSSAAVLTIFFERELSLNYSSIATYKNAYNILAIMLLPFFGKLIGKIDPRNFAIITFGSLLSFILFLGLTQYWDDFVMVGQLKLYSSLVVAFLFYGVFAATMALLWNIGSAYFAKSSDAGDYQSIHLSLTGFRALFSPIIGVFLYELIGYFYTFMSGVAALFIGIVLMLISMKKHRDVKS